MQTQINLRTLAAVSLASSTEETRFYLGGVLIQCRADRVTYVATDGHRMMVVRHDLDLKPRTQAGVGVGAPDEPNTLLGDFIIPTAVCRTFKPGKGKHKAGAFDYAKLTQNGVELRLESCNGVQVFKPVDGQFSDWSRVVPLELSGLTDFSKKEGKVSGVDFNPAYVSDFVKAGEIMDIGKPMLAFNSCGPAAVLFTDNRVLGILMPRRASTQAELQAKFADVRAFVLAEPAAESMLQAAK